jgi:hypothetical protein
MEQAELTTVQVGDLITCFTPICFIFAFRISRFLFIYLGSEEGYPMGDIHGDQANFRDRSSTFKAL